MDTVNLDAVNLLDGSVTLEIDYILKQCYSKDGDTVLLASSLIEGMGNRYSDLDVYVIKEGPLLLKDVDISEHHRVFNISGDIVSQEGIDEADTRIFLIHTVIPNTEIKIDVEFRTYSEIKQLFSKVNDIYGYAINNLELLNKRLDEREESILHRILHGCCVFGNDRYEALIKELNYWKYVYLTYRWIASDFSHLLDILGAWSKNEYDRGVELCRKNLLTQMQAYIHLCGVTNTDPKWMLFYLKKLFTNDLLNQELVSKFYRLYYFGDIKTDVSKKKYFIDALNFVDEIFHKSICLLQSNPYFPSGEVAIEKLENRFNKEKEINSYAKLEMEYRMKVYKTSQFPTSSLLINSI